MGKYKEANFKSAAMRKGGTQTLKKFFLLILMISLMGISILGCGGSSQEKVDTIKTDTWVNASMVSDEDGKPHSVQVRITNIQRQVEEVQNIIDEYNLSGTSHSIQALNSDDKNYVVATYEVKFPKDFPEGEYGITNVQPEFTIVGPDGKNEIEIDNTKYEGLNETWQIGKEEGGYDFYAGDTYQGQFVFAMVDGYSDYCIKLVYNDGENDKTLYFEGK